MDRQQLSGHLLTPFCRWMWGGRLCMYSALFCRSSTHQNFGGNHHNEGCRHQTDPVERHQLTWTLLYLPALTLLWHLKNKYWYQYIDITEVLLYLPALTLLWHLKTKYWYQYIDITDVLLYLPPLTLLWHLLKQSIGNNILISLMCFCICQL